MLEAQPFLFARFENAPSEGDEVTESRVEVMPAESSTGQQPSAAFDNPMYGTTKVRNLARSKLYHSIKVKIGVELRKETVRCKAATKYNLFTAA